MKNSKKEVKKLENLKLQAEQLLSSEMDVYRGGRAPASLSNDVCDSGCLISCNTSCTNCATSCTACTSTVADVIAVPV